MKVLAVIFFLFALPLFGDLAPFASQSDLVVDLSDSLLDGIYKHQLPCCVRCERSVWLEGFGSYRQRRTTSQRVRYTNGFGGLLGGFNYALSNSAALNFFVGGSWGNLKIREERSFDTESILFGTTLEKVCGNQFFGFAFATGVLRERRFEFVREKARGVFLTPEITYAFRFPICNLCPISTTTVRYAGFFPEDYQHREIFGTLYVRNRTLQFFTIREEIALPLFCYFFPYIGAAGRFQFSGHRVESRLLLSNYDFSSGIKQSIGYVFAGLRGCKQCGCIGFQGNFEASYDSDRSWRTLGELTFNYSF